MNAELNKTFWVQADGGSNLVEVSEEEYVRFERLAGFTNKYGSDDEPATDSFAYAGPILIDGKPVSVEIRGEVRSQKDFVDVAKDDNSLVIVEEGNVFSTLYVVRWMSHEYESGWGLFDDEEFCALHKTIEEAQNSVNYHFENKGRNLHRAGDCFIYPSGPDNKYHIYEIPVVEGHRVFDVINEDGLDIPKRPADPSVVKFREQLIIRMQAEDAIIHTIDCDGLSPKPLQSAPIYSFPQMRDPQWTNKQLKIK